MFGGGERKGVWSSLGLKVQPPKLPTLHSLQNHVTQGLGTLLLQFIIFISSLISSSDFNELGRSCYPWMELWATLTHCSPPTVTLQPGNSLPHTSFSHLPISYSVCIAFNQHWLFIFGYFIPSFLERSFLVKGEVPCFESQWPCRRLEVKPSPLYYTPLNKNKKWWYIYFNKLSTPPPSIANPSSHPVHAF